MGKRKELRLDEKVSLVEECLTGWLRMREAARRAGVEHSTMESWISRYRSEGISALEENGNQSKRRYDEDFKRKVVEAYMSGQGSSMAIAEKYQLRSGNLVLDWGRIMKETPKKRRGVLSWEKNIRWRNGCRRCCPVWRAGSSLGM